VRRVEVAPVPISDVLWIEQGATIMPRLWNEREAKGAAMSVTAWQRWARACTSAT